MSQEFENLHRKSRCKILIGDVKFGAYLITLRVRRVDNTKIMESGVYIC